MCVHVTKLLGGREHLALYSVQHTIQSLMQLLVCLPHVNI